MASECCRVLSIQSHVVHGHVGNKSVVFPLQLLGFEVDAIDTVQFSNHTGYDSWTGPELSVEHLRQLYDGLKASKVNIYTHMMTGYNRDPNSLLLICDIIRDLKSVNPSLVYLCDPVMGDNGQMYVPESVLPIYKENVLPLADIITPNQFEAELLSGIKILNEDDALAAMDVLHKLGIPIVVISSTDLGSDETLLAYGSQVNKSGKRIGVRMSIPKQPHVFVGTGDLFAALLLAHLHESKDLKRACEKTVSTMHAVLKLTSSSAVAMCGPGHKPSAAQLELRLVQSKRAIENCQITISAEEMKFD